MGNGNGAVSGSTGVPTAPAVGVVVVPSPPPRPVGVVPKPPVPSPLSVAEFNQLKAPLKSLGLSLDLLDRRGFFKVASVITEAKKRIAVALQGFLESEPGRKLKPGTPEYQKAVLAFLQDKTEFPLLPLAEQKAFLQGPPLSFGNGSSRKLLASTDRERFAHFIKLEAARREEAGKIEDAARLYERAAALDFSDPTLHFEAARAYQAWAEQETNPEVKAQLYADAFTHLEPFLGDPALDPEVLELAQEISKAAGLLEMDHPTTRERGIHHLEWFLSLAGQDAQVLEKLAQTYAERGDFAKAVGAGEQRIAMGFEDEETREKYQTQVAFWALKNNDPVMAYNLRGGDEAFRKLYLRGEEPTDPLEREIFKIYYSDEAWVKAAEASMARGDFVRARAILETAQKVQAGLPGATDDGIYFGPVVGSTSSHWREDYTGPSIADTERRIEEEIAGLPSRLNAEVEKLRLEVTHLTGPPLEVALQQLDFLEGVQRNLQILDSLDIRLWDVSKPVSDTRTQILVGVLYGKRELYETGIRGLQLLVRYQAAEAKKLEAYRRLRAQYPPHTRFVFETDISLDNPRVRSFLKGEERLPSYEMSLHDLAEIPLITTLHDMSMTLNLEDLRVAGQVDQMLEDLRSTRILPDYAKPGAPRLAKLDGDEKMEAQVRDSQPNISEDMIAGMSLEATTERLEKLYGGGELDTFLTRVAATRAEEALQGPGGRLRLEVEKQLEGLKAYASLSRVFDSTDPGLLSPEPLEAARDLLLTSAEDYKRTLQAAALEFAAEDEKDRPTVSRSSPWARGSLDGMPVEGSEGVGNPLIAVKDESWVSPRVAAIHEKIREIDAQVARLQAIDLTQLEGIAALQESIPVFFAYQSVHVRSLLEKQVSQLEGNASPPENYFPHLLGFLGGAFPVGMVYEGAALVAQSSSLTDTPSPEEGPLASVKAALDKINPNESHSAEELFIAYSDVSSKIDDAAFLMMVDARIEQYEQMQKSVQTQDRVVNATIAVVDAAGYKSGLSSDMAGDFRELIQYYRKVKSLYQEGKRDEAKRGFIILETASLHPRLQREYEISTKFNTAVAVGIIIAAVATGGVAAELAGPELLVTLGPEWAGIAQFGVNALVFTLSHRALTATVSGDINDFYNTRKGVAENILSFVEETALNFAMFKFLGGSQRFFVRFFERRLLSVAEQQLVKEGVLQAGERVLAGSAQEALLMQRVAALSEKWGVKLVLRAGSFTTELGAFGAWDFIALNYQLAKAGEFDPLGAAKQTLFTEKSWEDRFLFLVALKVGGILASPITKPMHEAARAIALDKYQAQLARLDLQIQESTEKLQAYVEGKGGNVFELARTYRKALEARKAILDRIPEYRDPTTYALNEYLLKEIARFEAEYETQRRLFSDYGVELTTSRSGTYPLGQGEAMVAELRTNPLCSVEVADNGLLIIEMPSPTGEGRVTLRLMPDRAPTLDDLNAMNGVPRVDPFAAAALAPRANSVLLASGPTGVYDLLEKIIKGVSYARSLTLEQMRAIEREAFEIAKREGKLVGRLQNVRSFNELNLADAVGILKGKIAELKAFRAKNPGRISPTLSLYDQIRQMESLKEGEAVSPHETQQAKSDGTSSNPPVAARTSRADSHARPGSPEVELKPSAAFRLTKIVGAALPRRTLVRLPPLREDGVLRLVRITEGVDIIQRGDKFFVRDRRPPNSTDESINVIDLSNMNLSLNGNPIGRGETLLREGDILVYTADGIRGQKETFVVGLPNTPPLVALDRLPSERQAQLAIDVRAASSRGDLVRILQGASREVADILIPLIDQVLRGERSLYTLPKELGIQAKVEQLMRREVTRLQGKGLSTPDAAMRLFLGQFTSPLEQDFHYLRALDRFQDAVAGATDFRTLQAAIRQWPFGSFGGRYQKESTEQSLLAMEEFADRREATLLPELGGLRAKALEILDRQDQSFVQELRGLTATDISLEEMATWLRDIDQRYPHRSIGGQSVTDVCARIEEIVSGTGGDIQSLPREFGLRQRVRDLVEERQLEQHLELARQGKPLPLLADQSLQDAYEALSEAYGALERLVHGRARNPAEARELSELIHLVCERGRPLQLITRDRTFRDQVEAYMQEMVDTAQSLYPTEMAEKINPFSGEKVRSGDLETEYRLARMILNSHAGRPVRGMPSSTEISTLTRLVNTHLGGHVGTTDYLSAQRLLREKFDTAAPEIETLLRQANAMERALILESYFGSFRHRDMASSRAALQVASLLGRMGVYREVGVTYALEGNSAVDWRVNLTLGDLGSVTPERDRLWFIFHSHPEEFFYEGQSPLGPPDFAQRTVKLVAPRSSDSRNIFFSDTDVLLFVEDAQRYVSNGFAGQFGDTPLYEAVTRTYRNWVLCPFGGSEINIRMNPNGTIREITIRYAIDRSSGQMDSSFLSSQQMLEAYIQSQYGIVPRFEPIDYADLLANLESAAALGD